MPAIKVVFDTYLLTTRTDVKGHFKVAHGLKFEEIHGMVVAVEDREKMWHTVELSNSVDNLFFWNPEVVAGCIESPKLANAPVQIILFVKQLRPIG